MGSGVFAGLGDDDRLCGPGESVGGANRSGLPGLLSFGRCGPGTAEFGVLLELRGTADPGGVDRRSIRRETAVHDRVRVLEPDVGGDGPGAEQLATSGVAAMAG